MLYRARTFTQRVEAIRIAISMGVGLGAIEEYLDHLELIRRRAEPRQKAGSSKRTTLH